MASPTAPISVVSPSDVHRFSHQAMACKWELSIAGESETYAAQCAQAAWDEVDNLETQLSRFIASSDVFQINALKAGESVCVGLATLQCLLLAREVHASTRGAFDITIGALMDENYGRRKNENSSQLALFEEEETRVPVGFHLLEIDADGVVSAREEGVKIDFGALGKGYALDQIGLLLRDWKIENALLHSGASSVLALGCQNPQSEYSRGGWNVALRDARTQSDAVSEVRLRDRALSGSGTLLHGAHIIDVRAPEIAATRAVTTRAATWASVPLDCKEALLSPAAPLSQTLCAARSDALSTAFMVMSCEEIEMFCRAHSEVAVAILTEENEAEITYFGDWNALEEAASTRT